MGISVATRPRRSYDEEKIITAQRQAEKRRASRDIVIPPVQDWKRRESCKFDFERYCRTYLAKTFRKPFCKDHQEIIKRLQDSILNDQDSATAADRGKGKSSLVGAACSWSIDYYHRRYPVWISATGKNSKPNYRRIKNMYELRGIHMDDFPEICIPIYKLNGSNRAAGTQTVNGERTRVSWSNEYLAYPFISGMEDERQNRIDRQFFSVYSMDAAIRGLNEEDVRPDLIILDDIESRETVKSQLQTDDLWVKIKEDIGYLLGQGESCTQIFIGSIFMPDSVADEITDPIRQPSWNGKRYKFLVKDPERMDLWQQYMETRKDTLNGGETTAAKFYKDNLEEMNRGAEVSWDQSFNAKKGEISALQHFFNCWADKGRSSVACEMQNDPGYHDIEASAALRPEDIMRKINRLERRQVPFETDILTAFIDVKFEDLQYVVLSARSNSFGGSVIDYGHHKVKALAEGIEASAYKAFEELTEEILAREYISEDGSIRRIKGCMIDAGLGQLTDTIYQFCRSNKYANILTPSKGMGLKPSDHVGSKANAKKTGVRWSLAPSGGKTRTNVLLCIFDANFWKTFVHNRLKSAMGSPDAFSLWGCDTSTHREFAAHMVSEKPTSLIVEKTGDRYEQWDQRLALIMTSLTVWSAVASRRLSSGPDSPPTRPNSPGAGST
jgi:hypothetical protein